MTLEATSTAELKQRDAASYDTSAAAFDRLTERFSTPLALEMLRLARLGPAHRVLDVGTGTGLVALQAAQAVPGCRAVGIDHSHGMLSEASAKARQRGLDARVEFRRMDAEALEFEDASFDAAVSLFVLLHLPDPSAALREMRRVLRPGGRVVIGVGSGPQLASLTGLRRAVGHVVERIAAARGRLLTAPGFLQDLMARQGVPPRRSDIAHHGPIDVAKLLRAAGFRDIARSWQGIRAELEPEEFWAVQATYGSPERIRLAELSPTQLAELKAAFLEECRSVQDRGGKLVYPFGAMFYTASA